MQQAQVPSESNAPSEAQGDLTLPPPEATDPSVATSTGTFSTTFRPGHNLTFLVTIQQSRWNLKPDADQSTRSVEDGRLLPGLALRYAFHLNLMSKFGLVMGTGAQFVYDTAVHREFRYVRQEASTDVVYTDFHAGSSVVFPSILFGIVQNFLAETRVLLLAEYAAAWYPNMAVTVQSGARGGVLGAGRRTVLAAIPDHVAVFAQLDVFRGRSWAFTGASGWRLVKLDLLGRPTNNSALNTLQPRNSSFFLQTGVTWTLGDELGR